jgi:hypothetical protein
VGNGGTLDGVEARVAASFGEVGRIEQHAGDADLLGDAGAEYSLPVAAAHPHAAEAGGQGVHPVEQRAVRAA